MAELLREAQVVGRERSMLLSLSAPGVMEGCGCFNVAIGMLNCMGVLMQLCLSSQPNKLVCAAGYSAQPRSAVALILFHTHNQPLVGLCACAVVHVRQRTPFLLPGLDSKPYTSHRTSQDVGKKRCASFLLQKLY